MSDELPPSLGTSSATQLFRLLLTVGNHLRSRMDARLAPTGLTTQQATALTIVDHADPPLTLGALARAMGSSHQNVRQIVAALERKGFVHVDVDPSDRRARRLTTTTSVAALFGPRDAADHAEAAGWLAVLSDDEQAIAVSLLARVLDHLVTPEPSRSDPDGRAPE